MPESRRILPPRPSKVAGCYRYSPCNRAQECRTPLLSPLDSEPIEPEKAHRRLELALYDPRVSPRRQSPVYGFPTDSPNTATCQWSRSDCRLECSAGRFQIHSVSRILWTGFAEWQGNPESML